MLTTLAVIAPLLFLCVVVAAVWLDRWSIPVILVALGLGLIAGSDVLGLWDFADANLANQLANAGLIFILFQGGLATKFADFRAVALPATGLATWGVLLTGAFTFACLHWVLGWSMELSLLCGAVISSTDAAAIFAILRRQVLPQRLSSTIELESAANDPMAILLTVLVVDGFTSGQSLSWLVLPVFLWKFAAGPVIGWLIARFAVLIFDRLNPQERGYYYVLLLSVVILTYGLAEAVQASSVLAVFAAGVTMGNERFIYKQGVRNFSAALSMIANIAMFVMMGLLVFPSQWGDLWKGGVLLFLVLTFVARPAAVFLGTFGMRIPTRDKLFMSWAGLRGAVPIVLATYPLAKGMPIGNDLFNLVFFAVLLSVAIQGSTLTFVARWLKLSAPARPTPRYGLDLITMAKSELDLFVVDLPDPKGRPGPRIRDLVLPPRAVITLIARGQDVVAPNGNARLLGWDQVTVLGRCEDEAEIRAALLEPFDHPHPAEEVETRVLDVDPPTQTTSILSGHVILIGHGRVGALLAGFLDRRDQRFVVIEQDEAIARTLRMEGTRVLQGSGDDPVLLERAGVRAARLLVVTSAEPRAVRRSIDFARRANPEIEIVTRVQNETLRQALAGLPRTRAVQSDLELGYAMARETLLACGISAIETEALLIDARRGADGALAARTHVVELHVPPTSPMVGKTLAELGLPKGSLVITIARGGEFVVPSGPTLIQAEDALLVLADADMARSIQDRLSDGHGPTPAPAPLPAP